jgi:hypothetical protein
MYIAFIIFCSFPPSFLRFTTFNKISDLLSSHLCALFVNNCDNLFTVISHKHFVSSIYLSSTTLIAVIHITSTIITRTSCLILVTSWVITVYFYYYNIETINVYLFLFFTSIIGSTFGHFTHPFQQVMSPVLDLVAHRFNQNIF